MSQPVLPNAKFEQVKKELQCNVWEAGTTVQEIITRVGSTSKADSFFIADLGDVVHHYNKWTETLPNIQPFYAVKSNPSLGMLKTLESLGSNFDCASKGEIELVLSLGINPERIIYAHPCKSESGLEYAKEHGVRLMTFDNANELNKIKTIFPDANLVIRVAVDDSYSEIKLGAKFGAHPDECSKLLKLALELQLNVVGISFHVGCDCSNATAYTTALALTRKVYDNGKQLGFNLDLVDIGGGFSGSNLVLFGQCAEVIRQQREELFGMDPQIRFIAEPGRFFAANAHTLALRVIGKRDIQQENSVHYNYFLGNGVFGSCISFLFPQLTQPKLYVANPNPRPPTSCTLFGPTCSSLDVLFTNIQLPELDIGDWVYLLDYGAYSSALASNFNAISPPTVYYFSTV